MGDAFIVRHGGVGKAFAAIVVMYPAGSTCTCTKGTKTLTAKDTSGSWIFFVPETGTYTVSCTDGTDTASKSVVIDGQYQTKNVVLTYETILYENGDLHGYDWKVCRQNFAYEAPTGNTLYVYQNGAGGAFVCLGFLINEKIDFTEYSTVKIHGVQVINSNKLGIFITDVVQPSNHFYYYMYQNNPVVASSYTDGTLPSDGIVTLDVSNISGEHYLSVGARCATLYELTFEVDKVWLE